MILHTLQIRTQGQGDTKQLAQDHTASEDRGCPSSSRIDHAMDHHLHFLLFLCLSAHLTLSALVQEVCLIVTRIRVLRGLS